MRKQLIRVETCFGRKLNPSILSRLFPDDAQKASNLQELKELVSHVVVFNCFGKQKSLSLKLM
jgi:hypothetical protein